DPESYDAQFWLGIFFLQEALLLHIVKPSQCASTPSNRSRSAPCTRIRSRRAGAKSASAILQNPPPGTPRLQSFSILFPTSSPPRICPIFSALSTLRANSARRFSGASVAMLSKSDLVPF